MSIRTRIILAALSVVIVANIIYSVYVIDREREEASARLKTTIEETNRLLGSVIAGPLYDGNVEQLSTDLDSFFLDPNIVSIALREKQGDIAMGRDRAAPTGLGELIDDRVQINRGIDELGEIRVTYTTANIEKRLLQLRNELIFLSVVSVLGLAMVIFVAARGLTRPIDRLTVAAQAMTDGRLDQDIEPVGAKEVIVLGQSFIQMRDAVRRQMAALEDKNRELSLEIAQRQEAERQRDRLISIVEATTDLISMADLQGNILYLNSAGRRLSGVGDNAIGEMQIANFHPSWATDVILNNGIPTALQEGYWSGDTALLTPDGHEMPVSQVIISHRNALGEVEYVSTIIRDITERKLAEAELRRFKTTLDMTHDCVFMFEPVALRFFYVNEAAARQVGYTFEELTAMTPVDIKPQFDEAAFRALIAPLLKGELSSITFETVHRHRDGHEISVETVLQYVFPVGESPRFIAIVRDITERKEAERALRKLASELEVRVRERTAELEAANKELEAFSYSVSHDLRAPLRAIDGFSRLLIEDYGPTLDGEAHDYLNRVRKAVQRMGGLIDDLLKLSRVTRAELHPTTVNLSDLASEIIADLRERDETRRVAVSIGPGFSVRGDPQLLRVVLVNLLENAWKYTGKTADPRIEFGSQSQDGVTTYFIRDNGAGFDMQYVGKLFGAFQRLHAEHEFPGTGIGLATVARIIHRHGGRVWAEAQPGQGATFYFTLAQTAG